MKENNDPISLAIKIADMTGEEKIKRILEIKMNSFKSEALKKPFSWADHLELILIISDLTNNADPQDDTFIDLFTKIELSLLEKINQN